MKHVLVVNPRFGDPSAPDTLRVRSMLPHLSRLGWRATIVSARGDGRAAEPRECEVSWIDPWPIGATRLLGIGSDGIRSWTAVRRRVAELRARDPADLAFFSTTAFELWSLGPSWRRSGLPYVLDWQDPWYDPNPPDSLRAAPPGGRLKYRALQLLARTLERNVAAHASAHVSVSAAYLEQLRERYSLNDSVTQLVEPFATDTKALLAARSGAAHERSGWVCVGRLGDGFRASLAWFFDALAARRPVLPPRFRIEFVGTGYGSSPGTSVLGLATERTVHDLVSEEPRRIPPDAALTRLASAERVLVFGSDDDRYVPSRLLNALGLGRPVVLVSARRIPSAWRAVVDGLPGVTILDPTTATDELWNQLLRGPDCGWIDRSEFLSRHSAEAMTARLVDVFDSVVARRSAMGTAS